MAKYAVVLRYVVEAEIEDIEANNQAEAIAKARSEMDGNLEHYMTDSIFNCTLHAEEMEE